MEEEDNDIELEDFNDEVLLQLDNFESALTKETLERPKAEGSNSDRGKRTVHEMADGDAQDTGAKREQHQSASKKQNIKSAQALELDDDLQDEADWNDSAFLAHLEEAEAQARSTIQQQQAQSGPSRTMPAQSLTTPSTIKQGPSRAVQRTLFGDVVPSPGVFTQAAAHVNTAVAGSSQGYGAAGSGASPIARREGASSSSGAKSSMVRKSTKQWDRSLYTAGGGKKKGPAVRGGSCADGLDDDEVEMLSDDEDGHHNQDDDDFETFAAAEEDLPPATSTMKLQVDREASKTWIYPTNKEHRDYQFNIVQRALFNNVLVALPTGLGKTFIAAVVILNYYRWYPKGKIIFVAPTKPLVAQQQQACHGICGLPWDQAVELTGDTKASLRGDEWKTKRIFYMTPQTFENDLCSSAIDTSDVICVVVDEAHRATGNYAYANVIRYLTARNPFFRILALTATPGSNTEKVQEVVDNLHINSIEIRSEKALDIRSYVHTKSEDPVVVPLGSVVSSLKERMCRIMRGPLERLNKAGIIHQTDPANVHPFSVTAAQADRRKRAVINQFKLYHPMTETRQMAEALRYLTEHSVRMFASRMLEFETGVNSRGTKASTKQTQNKMRNNTVIREMIQIFEDAQDKSGRISHPKMDYLKDVLAAHFADLQEKGQETRAMVFCQYRECVNEIVEMLNEDEGEIRATIFVGQAPDRNGGRGFTQKDQERVIKEFRKGTFNVLVATSIGEEGLDIGEVDLIVCYEAVKDSVRMLQRVGRTGRKRDGRIVVLMSEGIEERNWQKSKDSYKSIQNEITSGASFQLYDDVPRLVPDDIVSEVDFKQVEQPTFEPDLIRKNRGGAKKTAKPKRNSDPFRNMPKGALDGFVKVSDLRKSKAKTKTKKGRLSSGDREADDESSAEEEKGDLTRDQGVPTKIEGMSDDSDDEALAEGLDFDALRRMDGGTKGKARARSQNSVSGSSSPAYSNQCGNTTSSDQRRGSRLGVRRSHNSTIMSPLTARGQPLTTLALDSSPNNENSDTSNAWKVQSGSSKFDQQRPPLQAIGQSRGTLEDFEMEDDSIDMANLSCMTQDATDKNGHQQQQRIDAMQTDKAISLSPPVLKKRNRPHPLLARLVGDEHDSDEEGDDNNDREGGGRQKAMGQTRKAVTTYVVASSSPPQLTDRQSSKMGPPMQPASVLRIGTSKDKGNAKGKRRRLASSDEEKEVELVVSSQEASPLRKRVLHRDFADKNLISSDEDAEESKAAPKRGKIATKTAKSKAVKEKKQKEKKRRIGCSPTSRFLFQHEAERDTDEERHGERDEDDEGLGSDMADSSDLEHVGDFEPTQAPKGYHQSAIYFQSLNSQTAPSPFRKTTGGRHFPGFEVKGRAGHAVAAANGASRTPRRNSRPSTTAASSSGFRNSQTDDDYERGSFVCSDEDVDFDTDAEEDEDAI